MTLDDRVILIDKPRGITSFGAVKRVRSTGRLDKAGHCGSLDPLATGLLIVCTGLGTRVTSLFVDQPKEYRGRVRFGRATDTYDADGRVTREAPVPALDNATIRAALDAFVGEIQQIPPMVSALKVGGRRLYDMARHGEEIERAPRPVRVYGIDVLEAGEGYVDLRVRCGRGCYVRSIAHDLGQVLGVPAHLESLRRIAIGSLHVDKALSLEQLASGAGGAAEWPPESVLPLARALDFLPAVHVRSAFETRVRNGGHPSAQALVEPPAAAGLYRVLSGDGRLMLALGRNEAPRAPLRLDLVFHTPLAVDTEASPA
jgi:tRNA pseudouridine55 synthase